MSLQITLSQQEKMTLVYDIMRFVAGCGKVWNRDSPRIDGLWIIKCIIEDSQFSTGNQGIFIRELKKHSELWLRVSPFLINSNLTCGTKGCPHTARSHADDIGKCNGIVSKYVKAATLSNPWNYVLRKSPCKCTGFRPRQL